jgi:HAD superfamily hydrolase (TIGR01490 family)
MEKLAIFDVDYTLTKSETLYELFKFMLWKDKKLIKHLPVSLGSALLYVVKIFDEKKAKDNFIRFLMNIEEKELELLMEEFYEKKISKILYKDAIDRIKQLKNEGCKIYLISASPEVYLNQLYKIKEVDKIIGTRLKCEEKKYSIEGFNCKGEEKVKRLNEFLKENKIEVDYENSYMFSDSLSDLPLLELVGHPYLINYKKGHEKIEVLSWK